MSDDGQSSTSWANSESKPLTVEAYTEAIERLAAISRAPVPTHVTMRREVWRRFVFQYGASALGPKTIGGNRYAYLGDASLRALRVNLYQPGSRRDRGVALGPRVSYRIHFSDGTHEDH